MVAILGELLATLPRVDEEMLVFMSPGCLYWVLEEFTKELRVTLYRTDGRWCRHNVTSNDDDDPLTSSDDCSVTSLSGALDAYRSTPGTTWGHVTMVAREWQWSVSVLVNSWAELARKATELRDTCREMATEAANREATATTRARRLQDEAARDGTAQENMVGLGQALGSKEGAEVVARYEAKKRREARVAASEATRATMVRQQVEAALGLLKRLVAACDEATAFPRELQRRVGDIEAALKWKNMGYIDIPENLVAKVAVAERLWEANARLAKGHLLGTLQDIIGFYFTGDPTRTCGVAERCQRATEDIPRLLRPLEHPQSVPKISPVTMELQELSPALLQPQVTVVATLGELLATLPRWDEEMLPMSAASLYWALVNFTESLWVTLYCTDCTWWRRNVTCDDGDPLTSLSRGLAAYRSTTWTTWTHVTMVASKWQRSVSVLVNSWAQLARAATKLHSTCRVMVTEVTHKVATATARARELQALAACDGTAQENMVGLGQALGREEGAEVVAGREAQERREAMVAASEATRAIMVRQRVEAALGLLERLVAACDEATAFPRELQRRIGDIKATMNWKNMGYFDILEGLVAKVVVAERLWEANARLAKDHLLGTVDDIFKFYIDGDPPSPSDCGVAERCQRATEDIPRRLQPPECPQSIPKVSPVTMELYKRGEDADKGTEGSPQGQGPPQEATLVTRSLTSPLSPPQVSSPQLQVLVAVVTGLDEVVAIVTGTHWGKFPDSLHEDLKNFTRSLRAFLKHGGVTSVGNSDVPSLRRALATIWATPGTTWADVRAASSAWRELVAKLVDSWDWLVREATKLREKGVTAQQLMVAQDKKEVAWKMALHDAQVVRATNEAGAEAVATTRRGHWAVVALGPLQRLVAVCVKATLFYWNMEWQLRDIEAILKGTNEASPDVLQVLMAKVAKFEQLWDASTRLAKEHLLGTLEDIHNLLLSPCGDHCGPGGPGSRAVAERCQKAIEDIPRLLQESFT
ncbi:uncharacterized protein GJ701_016131 [Geothlypis trichas]